MASGGSENKSVQGGVSNESAMEKETGGEQEVETDSKRENYKGGNDSARVRAIYPQTSDANHWLQERLPAAVT